MKYQSAWMKEIYKAAKYAGLRRFNVRFAYHYLMPFEQWKTLDQEIYEGDNQ